MTRLRKLRDLAAIADVNEMTLRRAIDRGDLKAVKVGRVLRVDEDEFQKFLKPVVRHKEDENE